MNEYYLIGFLNLFNIVPDFVIPIFRKKYSHSFYIQYIENGILYFEEFPLYQIKNENFYNLRNSTFPIRNLNPSNNKVQFGEENKSRSHFFYKELPIDLINPTEPIFAFHNFDEIIYGELPCFIYFLNDFITDDKYLLEEINDFKEYAKVLVEKNKVVFTPLYYDYHPFDIRTTALDLSSVVKHNGFEQYAYPRKSRKKPVDELQSSSIVSYSGHDDNKFIFDVFPSDINSLIEVLDKELKRHSCDSEEYKKLIKILYTLLYKDTDEFIEKEFLTNILNSIYIFYKQQNND